MVNFNKFLNKICFLFPKANINGIRKNETTKLNKQFDVKHPKVSKEQQIIKQLKKIANLFISCNKSNK